MSKFCCEKFEREATPQDGRRLAQIEWNDGWCVNGCCGGGCYVLWEVVFCPYCGAKLEPGE